MDIHLFVLCVFLLGSLFPEISTKISDDHYRVMGVSCQENEVVSCTMINCPTGRYCPAANYCFDPKCVCRKGFRRVRGACVPKHVSLRLSKATLETALLEVPYREEFPL